MNNSRKSKNSFFIKIKSSSNTRKLSKRKSIPKSTVEITKKHDKKIKEYCEFYNKDIFGNPTPALFNSCKVNKYCRKTKCKNIDKKFKQAQIKELGTKYQSALAASVDKKCLPIISDKNYKNCRTKATKKFYKDNKLGDLYDKMLECDSKTCAKERNIFYTNLFRLNKKKKAPKAKIEDDLPPDQYLIETN